MEPDYSQYSLDELYDVFENINSEKYPDRLKVIKELINYKENILPQIKSLVLLDIEDSGVSFVINRVRQDAYEVKISITYNLIISFQKTWYSFNLCSAELKHLITCLTQGIESTHGNSSIWRSNQVIVKKRESSVSFCKVRMYRRLFILGFNIVPASISGKIIASLNEIEI
jgi:hypothetical protein